MLTDAEPISLLESVQGSHARGISAFLSFLEKKLGVHLLYDARALPSYGRATYREQLLLAQKLERAGILKSVYQIFPPTDEPRLKRWNTIDTTDQEAGGAGFGEVSLVLTAALAECLERYLWRNETDYFSRPVRTTAGGIARAAACVAPERFASYSPEQRKASPRLKLLDEAEYLWIRGYSHVTRKYTYVPAQTIAAHRSWPHGAKEPHIRNPITIGLATWPTKTGAQLAGANEVIEREAYMVMWLNQLTLPRISLEKVAARDAELSDILATCARYRLRVHAIPMITDAPTHAMCVIVEDETSVSPKFALGLKAHRSLSYAIKKALTEALRARGFARKKELEGSAWDASRPAESVGHYERLHYWGTPQHAEKLRFLVEGPIVEPKANAWDQDGEAQHLERIASWCRSKGFECVSVPLTHSKKNPTSLHIEMVVIPELLHTYLFERERQLSESRRIEVPKLFGYTPREKPFLDAPHPFA